MLSYQGVNLETYRCHECDTKMFRLLSNDSG